MCVPDSVSYQKNNNLLCYEFCPGSAYIWPTINPDKSEALIVGTISQLHAATSSISSVSVARVNLPIANDIKVLGVVLDRRLSFHKHVSAVARSCNYHAQAIQHIRHLLTVEMTQTLACSLILSRIDYRNTVLHCAPSYSIKLQPKQLDTHILTYVADLVSK